MAEAKPLPYTLLSLERYAALSGIAPPHFWGAAGETYFPLINSCNDIFYQFYWQSADNVSREEVANAIKEAEDEITRALGYSPAPVWVTDEVANYPQHYRRDVWEYGMSNARGAGKTVQLSNGKFIQGGRRALTLIADEVGVVYSDEDGDGFDETATITTPTTFTDKRELKCYYTSKDGAQEWEVRQPRSVTISGGNVTFVYWAWQMIEPLLQQVFPTTTGPNPIDLEDAASFILDVDVYREYNDFTQVAAQMFWERRSLNLSVDAPFFWCESCGNAGCQACNFITQDGCIHVRDANGINVVPSPATYNATTAQWDKQALTVCRDPDLVKLWYYAGDKSAQYLASRTVDPLSDYMADAIAWLATARVNRPFCTCNNSLTLLNNLQRDMSFTGSRELGSFIVSAADLDNPFGTKVGEVKAWHKVSRLASAMPMGAAV